MRAVEDKFYGDRSGTIEDPFGHQWHVGTHKEDVPPDEMQRRAAAMAKIRLIAAFARGSITCRVIARARWGRHAGVGRWRA